jgi:hypothetical protein
MPLTRPLCAAFAAILLISAVWFPGAQVATPSTTPPTTASPFEPVARVSSLMRGIGSAFGELSDVLPQTGEEFRLETVTAWSEVIAELSNVHTRHQRKPDYLEMATDTRSIALQLASAARADTPDEALLTKLFTNLDTSCDTCHEADD